MYRCDRLVQRGWPVRAPAGAELKLPAALASLDPLKSLGSAHWVPTSQAGPPQGLGVQPGWRPWAGSPGGAWVAQDHVPPSADGGKREVLVLPLRAQYHFILYCDGELDGRQIRVARLLGEGPAS